MLVAVVIPCFNEELSLEATCRSLGFGAGCTPDVNAVVILVDNCSTDGTIGVIRRIAGHAPSGSVQAFEELERGYVPPRRRGVEAAREIAAARGFTNEDTLIVQADADTVYAPAYLRRLADAAAAQGSGVLVEGARHSPASFMYAHPGFIELCKNADGEIASTFVDMRSDVVVDDKSCAYRLSDYFAWGGLTREFTTAGEEVYAESTRFYIKGRFRGARRSLVQDAIAYPSRRKVYANPVLYFATAGFPREPSWVERWNATYQGPNGLMVFEQPAAHTLLSRAIQVRQAHCMALFSTIPRIVEDLQTHHATLSALKRDVVEANTAILFESAFAGID
jgi:glycosyltransferase involved in cell wall biosynthesis